MRTRTSQRSSSVPENRLTRISSNLPSPGKELVIVTVKPGETTRGVIVDFKPPPPIVEPPTDDAKG